MARTKTTRGQALCQPGGAEEDSRFCEGNMHLCLAYKEEEEEEVLRLAGWRSVHSDWARQEAQPPALTQCGSTPHCLSRLFSETHCALCRDGQEPRNRESLGKTSPLNLGYHHTFPRLWRAVWRVWKEQESSPVKDCLESMEGTRQQTCGGLFGKYRMNKAADLWRTVWKIWKEQESNPVVDCLESMEGTREQTCGGLLGKYGRNKTADLWWTVWKVWKEQESRPVAD